MSTPQNPMRPVVPPINRRPNYFDFNKDSKSKKPIYLKKLPISERYPRTFFYGGTIISLLILYSAPLYYFLRTPGENEVEERLKWREEKESGKTMLEMFRERKQKEAEAREAYLARKKAFEEKIALAKAKGQIKD